MAKRNTGRYPQNAFTLIELLVVIAIIALLLAIIIPAISLAKEKAKTLVCSTNLKSLSASISAYATENDDAICGSWNYSPGNGWGREHDWAWAPWQVGGTSNVADYANATLAERHEGIKRGVLYPFIEALDAYHCVSDKSFAGNFRSYSMPDSLNGLWGQPTSTAAWDIMYKLSRISIPSNKYAFVEENDPRGYNINSWVIHPDAGTQSKVWADPLTVWHRGRSNFGYVDGHAKVKNWSRETEKRFQRVDESGSWAGFWGHSPQSDGEAEDLRWLLMGWPD